MAWLGTDSFESYANGNNLNTLNGGSGWSAAWSVSAGTWSITNATAAAGTTLSATSSSPGGYVNRNVASTTAGEVTMYMRKDGTNGAFYLNLCTSGSGAGANSRVIMGMETANIVAYDNGTQRILVPSFTTSTWYKITVKYGHVSNKFAVSINDGAYSADYAYSFGGSGAITNFQIYEGAGGTPSQFYFDQIAPYSAPPVGPTTIKTLNGVSAI